MALRTMALLALAAFCTTATAQAVKRFDGKWDATIVCHAATDGTRQVRAYALQMTGLVHEGQFAAVRGTEGKPGWSYLHGGIDNDGHAVLVYETVLTDKSLSISDKHKPGDKVSWQATARFTKASGSGQRLDGRKCDLQFAMKPPRQGTP